MSDDGGPSEHAKLRERFAVAIVAAGLHVRRPGDMPAAWVLDDAQKLTDEAIKRRKQDAVKPRPELTPVIVRNALLLVARDVPLAVIAGWTDEQQREAGEWAVAVADSASDKDDVPLEPEWSKPYEVDFRGRLVHEGGNEVKDG